MIGAAPAPTPSHGHRSLRLAAVVGIVVLLAILGTYWTTETIGPSHSPTTVVGGNRTTIIYHNATVFENTTDNMTTPVYHNTTVWQNSTDYQNNTVYHTTTVYVNTTQIVLIPVVNITGITWVFNSSGHFAGTTSATLIAPDGEGFVHSYPLGTVMWILVNVTNQASSSGILHVNMSSPFFLVDSQPAVPHLIAADTTMNFELSIGVPYAPGEYSMVLNVTVG